MGRQIDQPRIWWEDITGPRSIIEEIVDSLSDLKSVALELPVDCPWVSDMRLCAESRIRDEYGLEDLSLEVIADPGDDPLKYLLDHFARSEDRRNYRSSFAPQTYLRDHEVTKGKIIWVVTRTETETDAWSSFVSNWKPSSPVNGLFVIEAGNGVAERLPASPDRLCHIDYNARVSGYSISLFNGSLVAERSNSDAGVNRKRYQAALLTHVCGRNVEVAEMLSGHLDDFASDPIGTLKRAAVLLDNRDLLDGTHIFALCNRNNAEEVNRRVWAAQVEVLFPLIETLRLSIVESLADKLSVLLADEGLRGHDGPPTNIEDIELGGLVYLMASQKLEPHDPSQKRAIHLLRNCRNDIAHRRACPWEEVEKLLELVE